MRKTLLLSLFILFVPLGAAQAADLDVGPGMIGPDSPLYGLGVMKDDIMMGVGLSSPGKIAQKRAAEAQQMQEKGNYAAAERAAQELSKVEEKASEEDTDGIEKATAVLQEVYDSAPEESKGGLQTAMENLQRGTSDGAGDDASRDASGGGSERVAFTRTDVSCEDGLIDTHAHVHTHGQGDPLTPGMLAERMSQHDEVSNCAVMFMMERDITDNFTAIQEDLAATGVAVVPFIEGGAMFRDASGTLDRLEGDITGLGEFGPEMFQGEPFQGGSWPTILEQADERGLIVMIHPTEGDLEAVRQTALQYPDAIFLLHGFESLDAGGGEALPSLLADQENIYWTHDLSPYMGPHLLQQPSADAFLDWWDAQDEEQKLSQFRSEILPLLEAAPDKVMWGTDAARDWSKDPDVYTVFVQFSMKAINSLPEEHQDAYAYENAQRLFGTGVTFEAPEDYTPQMPSEASDPAEADGGLGDLCGSEQECMTYCQDNYADCEEYCEQNPDNAMCADVKEFGEQMDATGEVSGGMGDFCGSMQECMTYCGNNQQDCINYCMENPENEVCQHLMNNEPQ